MFFFDVDDVIISADIETLVVPSLGAARYATVKSRIMRTREIRQCSKINRNASFARVVGIAKVSALVTVEATILSRHELEGMKVR